MRKNSSLRLFYLLIGYVVLQLLWWGHLIISAEPHKFAMILSEFIVFVSLLIWGALHIKKAIQKEINLRGKQHDFLLSVTHELKSPLSAVKLYLQTLLKRKLPKVQRDTFIRHALLDVERLHALAENMLMATQIEQNAQPSQRINLSELLLQTVQYYADKWLGRVLFVYSIQPDISILGDGFTLKLALGNLIENAIKYSLGLPKVHIQLSMEGTTQATLTVKDQGVGIPIDQKKRVFDKFYRLEQTEVHSTTGTGLGLFIVKQVAQQHWAGVQIKDNQPKGSIFELVFQTASKLTLIHTSS